MYRLVACFIWYWQFSSDIALCDCVFGRFLHCKASVLFTMLTGSMHSAFFYKHCLINLFWCCSLRIGCRWSCVVTWGARALCIGCNCGWSGVEPERSELVAAPVGHVVRWPVEWHVVDDITGRHTACWRYVIVVDEFIIGLFSSLQGRRSRRRCMGGRSLLQPASLWPCIRGFMAECWSRLAYGFV